MFNQEETIKKKRLHEPFFSELDKKKQFLGADKWNLLREYDKTKDESYCVGKKLTSWNTDRMITIKKKKTLKSRNKANDIRHVLT